MNLNMHKNLSTRLALLSFFSKEDNCGGLAVYDLSNSTVRYVHVIDFSQLPGRLCHLRGVHWVGEKLYAVSPFALFIFAPGRNLNGPGLVLEKTICLREWILGQGQQGNLHAVCAVSSTNTLHVSFNAQGAIDTLDLDGNFLRREHLWEITPDLFLFPKQVPKDSSFRFGVVRHMFEDQDNELIFVTSFVNDTRQGALIAARSGKVLFKPTFNPHGGFVYEDRLYLSDIDAGLVHVYPWSADKDVDNIKPEITFSPVVNESFWSGSIQNVRGVAVLDGRLVCGVCHFGKAGHKQIPPRLVDFDLKTGCQISEHFLPNFVGLRNLQVYSVNAVPPWLADTVCRWDEAKYFRHEEQFNPELLKRVRCVPSVKKVKKVQIENSLTYNANNCCDQIKVISDLDSKKFVSQISIKLDNVDLCFVRRARSFFGFNSQLRKNRSFLALRNVSFVLREGETVGVIGRNGSGKSTLSLVCAGVYKPDLGSVTINGRVQLLALGVGFKTELSGRDNVFISASLLGLSRKKTHELFPEIEAFAELGEFIDEPVRTYSSGMKSKLGFAVATAVEPEILILDEAMSVGDKAFKDKAMARMREMQKKAKSVLIVSHNPGEIKKLCSRVLWMERGRLMMDGDANTVVHAYENFCKNPEIWLLRNPEYILETV